MNTNAHLNSEFNYDENCPCQGCPHEGACTLDAMACEDFLQFAGTGENRNQSREPSAETYHKLFPSSWD